MRRDEGRYGGMIKGGTVRERRKRIRRRNRENRKSSKLNTLNFNWFSGI